MLHTYKGNIRQLVSPHHSSKAGLTHFLARVPGSSPALSKLVHVGFPTHYGAVKVNTFTSSRDLVPLSHGLILSAIRSLSANGSCSHHGASAAHLLSRLDRTASSSSSFTSGFGLTAFAALTRPPSSSSSSFLLWGLQCPQMKRASP